MNRLEKLKKELKDPSLHFRPECEGFRCGAHKSWDEGFDAASDEYEKIIADAINTVKSWYPVDVFPEDGQSIDSKCAKMARKTCENILAEIQKLKDFIE